MRDDYGWLGQVLGWLNRPRGPDRAAIAEIAAVAERVNDRADTIAAAFEAIAEKLDP